MSNLLETGYIFTPEFTTEYFPDLSVGTTGYDGELGDVIKNTLSQKRRFIDYITDLRPKLKQSTLDVFLDAVDAFQFDPSDLKRHIPFDESANAMVYLSVDPGFPASYTRTISVKRNIDYYIYNESYNLGESYPLSAFTLEFAISGGQTVYTIADTLIQPITAMVMGAPGTAYQLNGEDIFFEIKDEDTVWYSIYRDYFDPMIGDRGWLCPKIEAKRIGHNLYQYTFAESEEEDLYQRLENAPGLEVTLSGGAEFLEFTWNSGGTVLTNDEDGELGADSYYIGSIKRTIVENNLVSGFEFRNEMLTTRSSRREDHISYINGIELVSSVDTKELLYEDVGHYKKLATTLRDFTGDLGYDAQIDLYTRDPESGHLRYEDFREFDVSPGDTRSISRNPERYRVPTDIWELNQAYPDVLYNHCVSARDYIKERRKILKEQFEPFYTLEELQALYYRGQFYKTRQEVRRLEEIVNYHNSWLEIIDRIELKNSSAYNSNFYKLVMSEEEVERVLLNSEAVSDAREFFEENTYGRFDTYTDTIDISEDSNFDMVEFFRNRIIDNDLDGLSELKTSVERRLAPVKKSLNRARGNLSSFRNGVSKELNKRTGGNAIKPEEFDFKFRFANKKLTCREEFTVTPDPTDFFNNDFYTYLKNKYLDEDSSYYFYRCQLDPVGPPVADPYMRYISSTDPLSLFYTYFENRNKNIPVPLQGTITPYGYKSDFVSILTDIGHEITGKFDELMDGGKTPEKCETYMELARGADFKQSVGSSVVLGPDVVEVDRYSVLYDTPWSKSTYYGLRRRLIEGPTHNATLIYSDPFDVFDLDSFLVPAGSNGFHHYRPVGVGFPSQDGVGQHFNPGEFYNEFVWFREITTSNRLLVASEYDEEVSTFDPEKVLEYTVDTRVPPDFGPIRSYNAYPVEKEEDHLERFVHLPQPKENLIYPTLPVKIVGSNQLYKLKLDRSWNQSGSVYIDTGVGLFEKVFFRSRVSDNVVLDIAFDINANNTLSGIAVPRDISLGNEGILPNNYAFTDWYANEVRYPDELLTYTSWLKSFITDPAYYRDNITTIRQLQEERIGNVPGRGPSNPNQILNANDYILDET